MIFTDQTGPLAELLRALTPHRDRRGKPETVFNLAVEIALDVQGESNPEAVRARLIRDFLAGGDPEPLIELALTLAGMADLDRTPEQMFAWGLPADYRPRVDPRPRPVPGHGLIKPFTIDLDKITADRVRTIQRAARIAGAPAPHGTPERAAIEQKSTGAACAACARAVEVLDEELQQQTADRQLRERADAVSAREVDVTDREKRLDRERRALAAERKALEEAADALAAASAARSRAPVSALAAERLKGLNLSDHLAAVYAASYEASREAYTRRAALGAPDTSHGTRAGYRAHLARGEDACDPCDVASQAYDHARWDVRVELSGRTRVHHRRHRRNGKPRYAPDRQSA